MSLVSRRTVLQSLPVAAALATSWSTRAASAAPDDKLRDLESTSGGRLGVAALNLANRAAAQHRADERFALCSTFKLLAVSAILRRSAAQPGLLRQRLDYTRSEIVSYSPITSQHIGEGMTVAGICAAALQYSDNTAANLMLRLLGGPAAVTAFARSIGDNEFRLDRWETTLNSAIPGDPRDTSTPDAMLRDLHRLALGDALRASEQATLLGWMRGCTTGSKRIRAGVPAGWTVADKTGSGDYGTTNDIAVVWPPGRSPILLAIYFTQRSKHASMRDDVVAAATRVAIGMVT